jgi:hypothetical protein
VIELAAQGFTAENFVDDDGNPAGGYVSGTGFAIAWQNGPIPSAYSQTAFPPLRPSRPNGAFVEDVIAAAKQRIEHYQDGKFACRENALAITKLEEALLWLNKRTADRTARGVEGTHEV